MFEVPEPKPPAAPIPKRLQNEIEESTNQFRARFGMMRTLAESNGWIRDYQNELERLVRLALETK